MLYTINQVFIYSIIVKHILCIKSDLTVKRAEVSATQATIRTKIQQFYQALSVATDLQLRRAVIIRYGSNYNYIYRIESKQNSVYQFCSQQQNGDTHIILRTLNIKPSDSTAWLFDVSGASANTLTEQTTANDSSVWELYY